jgi:hypothetical protein
VCGSRAAHGSDLERKRPGRTTTKAALQQFHISDKSGGFIVRTSAGVLSLLLVLSAFGQVTTPDGFLERGTTAFRSGDYGSAVIDLQAAAQGYMSPENMQRYVNTGKFENLDKLEEALVYLALSQSKLGREGDARETILRLMSAERIKPTYERLQIAEAKDFDMLVASLVPTSTLPPNMQIAAATPAPTPTPVAEETTAALPAVTAAPAPVIAEVTPEQTPVPAEERFVTQRTVAEERAERERIVAELVARERERIEKEAAARIAQAREAANERVTAAEQRATTVETEAQQRIAAAQTEAEQRAAAAAAEAQQKAAAAAAEAQQLAAAAEADAQRKAAAAETEAQQRIAAAQREAEQKIAALQNESQERLTVAEADAASRIAAARKEAEERVAAAEAAAKRDAEARVAALQQETERRIAAERAEAERAAAAQIAEAAAATRRTYVTSLRQADALANKGDLEAANAIYQRVANTENAPRELIAEAAVGMYRTGAFRNSAAAFKRLGLFAKGEEDLRYYNAVALYEIGKYQEAKKELACALPYIQLTEDVSRYRAKIEQTASQQAMR